MDNQQVVIAGPWFGEFGGELEDWHAWIRYLRHQLYPNAYFVVCGFPGRQLFYEFANEYWELPDFFLNKIRNKQYFTRWASLVDTKTGQLLPKEHLDIQTLIAWLQNKTTQAFPNSSIDYIQPHIGLHPSAAVVFPKTQEYKLIRTSTEISIDKYIVVFPRKRLNEPYRNWKQEEWEKLIPMLIDKGYTVVTMGASYETESIAYYSPKHIQVLDASLDLQVAYLQKAHLAITPICGAIRFAAYVGCPTVTFGSLNYVNSIPGAEGKPLTANPFNTPLYILAKGNRWDYTAHEVFDFVVKYI
jgi:hypothetical protein